MSRSRSWGPTSREPYQEALARDEELPEKRRSGLGGHPWFTLEERLREEVPDRVRPDDEPALQIDDEPETRDEIDSYAGEPLGKPE